MIGCADRAEPKRPVRRDAAPGDVHVRTILVYSNVLHQQIGRREAIGVEEQDDPTLAGEHTQVSGRTRASTGLAKTLYAAESPHAFNGGVIAVVVYNDHFELFSCQCLILQRCQQVRQNGLTVADRHHQ
jgi:hypothetical protein